eukprot:CAMPEP_0206480864 /NCGR_PEP_ID=MMETSP0324_2-20121206/37710_1 /ASSEMBLY_ACC=CAM_ASM_000836 /TAXON_ID=2866 /ORGANISM="Crypthecodinium cohnii, Strain Seligo" /LENGTH=47 /DNA_ID= /DNA_START= /DNA_END= /DNA_ORIENTATION=
MLAAKIAFAGREGTTSPDPDSGSSTRRAMAQQTLQRQLAYVSVVNCS